jgi:multiple sugar transport system ATP-binding protein
LDASARETVRTDILDLIHRLGVATLYVTHDQIEALCLADRVAVMRLGRVEQLGTPEEVYGDPQRLFVAAFVGSPRMNLLQAAIYAEPGERTVIDLGSQALTVPWTDDRARVLAEHHTARVTVGLRPDALRPVNCPDEDSRCVRGIVRVVEHRGHDAILHVETGSAPTPISISQLEHPDAPGELTHIVGEEVERGHPLRDRLAKIVPLNRRDEPERYALQPAYDPEHDFVPLLLGDLTVRVPAVDLPRTGDTISLAVDIDQLYFFDRAGDRIHG